MREFFRGWKRKVGCVTLVVACVFAAGWVRGIGRLDIIYFNTTKSNLVALSGCGRFWTTSNTQFSISVMSQMPGHIVLKICPNNTFMPNDPYITISRGITWQVMPANELGIFDNVNHDHESVTMIPYWSIVVPLTVLSAWLLLSKPRSLKPNPTSESQAT